MEALGTIFRNFRRFFGMLPQRRSSSPPAISPMLVELKCQKKPSICQDHAESHHVCLESPGFHIQILKALGSFFGGSCIDFEQTISSHSISLGASGNNFKGPGHGFWVDPALIFNRRFRPIPYHFVQFHSIAFPFHCHSQLHIFDFPCLQCLVSLSGMREA